MLNRKGADPIHFHFHMMIKIQYKTMETEPIEKTIQLAEILLIRLEKISADSPWAHQASGVRASIAKILGREEVKTENLFLQDLKGLIQLGFEILEKAAGDIPDPIDQR
jgi:hypothetical protein